MLTLKNLQIGYSYPLNHPFSYNFSTPQTIAVVGDNGTGKTTLLKTIAGLIKPINGTIILQGKKLSPNTDIKHIVAILLSYIPQKLELTTEQVIKNFPKINHHHYEQAVNWLNINNLLHKKFSHLSDGQKKRVLIARLLAQNTPIILLDEPDTHLDFNNLNLLITIINNLKNKLIIYSSHNPILILQTAHKVLYIKDKKITPYITEDFFLKIKFNELKSLYNFFCPKGVIDSENIIHFLLQKFNTKNNLNYSLSELYKSKTFQNLLLNQKK